MLLGEERWERIARREIRELFKGELEDGSVKEGRA